MTRRVTHGIAVLLAAVPLVASVFPLLVGLVWGLGLQCDESCGGDDWRHTADAPQWALLPVLGAIVTASGIALFVSVGRSQPGRAVTALLLGSAATVVGAKWWGGDWQASFERHPLLIGLLAVIFFSGLIAALLCAGSDAEGGARDRRD